VKEGRTSLRGSACIQRMLFTERGIRQKNQRSLKEKAWKKRPRTCLGRKKFGASEDVKIRLYEKADAGGDQGPHIQNRRELVGGTSKKASRVKKNNSWADSGPQGMSKRHRVFPPKKKGGV